MTFPAGLRPCCLGFGPSVCVCVAQYVAFLSTPANQGGDKDRGDRGTGYGGIEEIEGQDMGDRGDIGTGHRG